MMEKVPAAVEPDAAVEQLRGRFPWRENGIYS